MTITISLEGSVALAPGGGPGIEREVAGWLARAGAAGSVEQLLQLATR